MDGYTGFRSSGGRFQNYERAIPLSHADFWEVVVSVSILFPEISKTTVFCIL
jgi:hypothetical protein